MLLWLLVMMSENLRIIAFKMNVNFLAYLVTSQKEMFTSVHFGNYVRWSLENKIMQGLSMGLLQGCLQQEKYFVPPDSYGL